MARRGGDERTLLERRDDLLAFIRRDGDVQFALQLNATAPERRVVFEWVEEVLAVAFQGQPVSLEDVTLAGWIEQARRKALEYEVKTSVPAYRLLLDWTIS